MTLYLTCTHTHAYTHIAIGWSVMMVFPVILTHIEIINAVYHYFLPAAGASLLVVSYL